MTGHHSRPRNLADGTCTVDKTALTQTRPAALSVADAGSLSVTLNVLSDLQMPQLGERPSGGIFALVATGYSNRSRRHPYKGER
ncbi:hypothetical protein [Nonomuraea sp. NPDC049480]|uniref:hypothetical protein n=1 Tax=Nonomuraea sp. NPDC049480 TaxID=3364353 RepID=UPI0037AE04D4